MSDTEAPPPAAQRVADEVLRRLGLGALLALRVAPGGLLNQNLIAATARGRYFLKGYRYADPAPIVREHRLLAFVTQAGLPAVAPAVGPDGATFLRAGGRYWSVFPLIADPQPAAGDLAPAHAAEMGRVLGRIHAALAEFPSHEMSRYPPRLDWDTQRALQEMAEYERQIARRAVPDPFDQHALASFAYRRTLLAGGVPGPEAFASLPVQLLHGDYHERNLFFAPSGTISGVIDWELSGVGPRAWEIVRTLDVALGLMADVTTGGARLRAFLHGYVSQAPLTRAECAAMPDLYWAARVHSLWVYEEHYRKGAARTDRLAMEDLTGLTWWVSHRRQLAVLLDDAMATAPQTQLQRST